MTPTCKHGNDTRGICLRCKEEKDERVSDRADKLVGLRPTDEEIQLEARQWAQEHGTYGELHKASFILGAEWARSVAQYGKNPNDLHHLEQNNGKVSNEE